MKRIKIEQEIRRLIYTNKLCMVKSAVVLLPEDVDKTISVIKKLIYNNYRRRK